MNKFQECLSQLKEIRDSQHEWSPDLSKKAINLLSNSLTYVPFESRNRGYLVGRVSDNFKPTMNWGKNFMNESSFRNPFHKAINTAILELGKIPEDELIYL